MNKKLLQLIIAIAYSVNILAGNLSEYYGHKDKRIRLTDQDSPVINTSKYKSIEFTNKTDKKIHIAIDGPGMGAGGSMNSGYGGNKINPGETRKINAYVENENQITIWTDSNTEGISPIEKLEIKGTSLQELTYDELTQKIILQNEFDDILDELLKADKPIKDNILKRLVGLDEDEEDPIIVEKKQKSENKIENFDEFLDDFFGN